MLIMRKHKGFTLIEAAITVAILGILAGIAWPFYESQARKNRRTEAISNLTQLQVILERCYADNGGYDCCQPVVNAYLNPPFPEPSRVDNYNITFASTNTAAGMFACKQDQGYTLTAVPIGGTSQIKDDNCQLFEITHTGARRAEDNTGTDRPACWTD